MVYTCLITTYDIARWLKVLIYYLPKLNHHIISHFKLSTFDIHAVKLILATYVNKAAQLKFLFLKLFSDTMAILCDCLYKNYCTIKENNFNYLPILIINIIVIAV